MNRRVLSPNFYCPLSGEILLEPVVDADGNVGSRRAVFAFVQKNGCSPFNGRQMSVNEIHPNITLQQRVTEAINADRQERLKEDALDGWQGIGVAAQINTT